MVEVQDIAAAATPSERERESPYLGELRLNWRYLGAACLGLGSGYFFMTYIANIFTPHLLTAFGWSKAQISAMGATVILSMICQPVAGRLTDVLGARTMALVGV